MCAGFRIGGVRDLGVGCLHAEEEVREFVGGRGLLASLMQVKKRLMVYRAFYLPAEQ